jgi:hypothetical protein
VKGTNNIPKMGIPQKEIRKKWHVFRARKLTINFPSFTSNPPQLHHQNTTFYHPFSPKPPAKTRSHHPQKSLQSIPPSGGVLAPSGDDAGGYFVQVLELEAPRAPTRESSPATENGPRASQNPSRGSFLWRKPLRLKTLFYGGFREFCGEQERRIITPRLTGGGSSHERNVL